MKISDMETANLKKYLSYGYLGVMAVYLVVMFLMCVRANAAVSAIAESFTDGSELSFNLLSAIQKPMATANIIFFVVHLALALVIYIRGSKKVLAYLPVLIFTVFTLYGYVSLSGAFFSIGGQNASLSGTYWLMFFIGLFFVAGAIAITVIGLIAARNLLNRQTKGQEKSKE